MDTKTTIRFQRVRLQNFRNIEWVELPMEANKIFFLGKNGQGKSNLLEALGLVTAFKSFRTNELKPLIRFNNPEAAVWFEITQKNRDRNINETTTLELRLNNSCGKHVLIDDEPCKRIRDLLGRFPTVLFASDDIQLLRGGPGERRRWVDLLLSITDADYFHALVDYHRGLQERNRLLKKGGTAPELSAFESTLAGPATTLTRKRQAAIDQLSNTFMDSHAAICQSPESVSIHLKSDMPTTDTQEYLRSLAEGRERDRLLGSTRHGPHRDDLNICLMDEPAKVYGSDGQQRSLVLALRMTQAKYISEKLQRGPVLLADDIIGELDGQRREGFWKLATEGGLQVIATGTELPPDSSQWAIWTVENGQFTAKA